MDQELSDQTHFDSSSSSFLGFSTPNNVQKQPIEESDYTIGYGNLLPLTHLNEGLMEVVQRNHLFHHQQQQQLMNMSTISSNNLKLPKSEQEEKDWGSKKNTHSSSSSSSFQSINRNPLNFNHQFPHQTVHGSVEVPPSSKRFRSIPSPICWNSFPKLPPPPPPPPVSVYARQRRKQISDRTSCLQKLMPWDKKMDTATMLGEAHKYIKFLKAQIIALQSMPLLSSQSRVELVSNSGGGGGGGGFGGLEKLNRQQLLKILVNSPVAQTVMYSQELCVYSMEQIVLLKGMIEVKRHFLKQMVLFGSSPSDSSMGPRPSSSSFLSQG